MKWLQFFGMIASLTITISSAAQVKAGTIVRTKEIDDQDSIVYYDQDVATKQKSYMNLLVGNWVVTTMKRQAKMDAEYLKNVALQLNADSTFSGKAGCNSITGKFSIKGTSIKFNDISSTKMTCANQDQENWFLKLLQQTVSAYSVNNNTLFLRDGSSNIVFEASRKSE